MTTHVPAATQTIARASHRSRHLVRKVALGLLFLLLGLLVLSALSNIGLPTASQMVERLSPHEKARLAEATHLRETLGDVVWPGWGEMEIPLLVYNEAYAFLTGYDEPPAGWLTVPRGEQHGQAWERVPGDTFDGAPYYRQPLRDGVTPQAFTVRVGERGVASLATMEWMKISLRQDIREQLPGFLAPVVPYRLLDRLFVGSSDWYMAALLHESFHSYQDAVAPAHLASSEEAVRRYESQYSWEEDGLQAAWQTELDLLSEAVGALPADAPRYAQEFLTLREQRRAASALSPPLVRYEQQREWSEGLAKYVELAIWQAAATSEEYQPLDAITADPWFKGYGGTFDQRWSQEVEQIRRMAGDAGDGRFYYSGWAQAVLLDRLMPGWKQVAVEEGASLEALLEEAIERAARSADPD